MFTMPCKTVLYSTIMFIITLLHLQFIIIVLVCVHAGTMANEVLKQIFREMQPQIVRINPDPIMDILFAENIICEDDCSKLRHLYVAPMDRCRELLFLLHQLPHPQVFIRLRLALLNEYPWIVDDIDKKLPSLTSQLQQLHLGNCTDGKHYLRYYDSHRTIIIQ